jgi:glycosyltransferase involved in cell wall biosynthesis
MDPLVSIIIPTYNCAPYIHEAIESVLAQTYKNNEIIVVDDGSTDNTQEIIRPFLKKILYIKQENSGPSAARNVGIKKSKGDYIAFLDADDHYLPPRIELMVNMLQEDKDLGFASADVNFFEDQTVILKCLMKKEKKVATGWIYDKLIIDNYVSTLTVTIKRHCFNKSGYFDPSFNHGEDYDLWLRLAKNFKYEFLEEPLAEHRIREGSLSTDYELFLKERIQILQKHFKLFPDFFDRKPWLKKRALGYLYFRYCSNFLEQKEFKMAKDCLINTIKFYPALLFTRPHLLAAILPNSLLLKLMKH